MLKEKEAADVLASGAREADVGRQKGNRIVIVEKVTEDVGR